MKVLFVMLHAGFVRNYDASLRLMAERGHRIHIAHELDRKKHGENVHAARLAADCQGVTYGPAPMREPGLWNDLARIVRTFLDYLRYLEPRYAVAVKLRAPVEAQVPVLFLGAARLSAWAGVAGVRALAAAFRGLEGLIPSSATIDSFLREQAPDLVLVTPLVDVGSGQTDFVKEARAQRLPSGLCVASWDNLTNKGLMRIVPDRVFVWNELQKEEAVSLHGVPPGRVVITGAQISTIGSRHGRADHMTSSAGWSDCDPIGRSSSTLVLPISSRQMKRSSCRNGFSGFGDPPIRCCRRPES